MRPPATSGSRRPLPDTTFISNANCLGGGYGVLGVLKREAIRLLAQTEGIFLGPVYTGRAFAGMLDLIRSGRSREDENVLFWHTGGAPALFAYAEELRCDS